MSGWRKGYYEEYKAKKELIEEYGIQNVIKVAIAGAVDYIILKKGRVEKFVEVKRNVKTQKHSKKYKNQIKRIIELAREHNTKFEVWNYEPNKEKTVQYFL